MATRKSGKGRSTSAAPKRVRQPEVTRRNILAAARTEFAAKGLAGARVDEIAATAGSNKRMLYEYFGNKEALWLTVLEQAYEHMRSEEHALDVAKMSPAEGMRYLMEFNFRYCSQHPEFIALVNNENLHRARYLKGSQKVRKLYSPLLAMIRDLLERGVATGVFRRDVDPIDLYITIAALGWFYFSNNHTLSAIFGRNLQSPAQQRARLAHTVDVILGYLRP